MSSLVLHVPFTILVDLVEERISVDKRSQIMRHLDECADCRAEYAHLVHLIGLMRNDVGVDAPAPVIDRAVTLFRPLPIPAAPNLLQRVVASLRFDSAQLAPAMGVRSVAEGQLPGARQLLYSTAEHDLDLRIIPEGDGWIVAGQVFSPIIGGYIELHGVAGVSQAVLNEVSEFTLAPTAAGVYQLYLYLTTAIVEVNNVPIGV